MLDFTKLAKQIPDISEHLSQEATASRTRLETAQQLYQQAAARQAELVADRQTWRDRIWFDPPDPVEPLSSRIAISTPPERHTVFATDGSQIAPSHHEIAYCYLINVGRVMLHYGQSRQPLLDSIPEVFYRPEDLYVSRQWGIQTQEWMGYRRTVSEAIALADLAIDYRVRAKQTPTPALAMVDGSLVLWFLENLPYEARDRILPPILDAWEKLRLADVPLVGYISASRSSEAMRFLRLQACEYETPDCLSHCPPYSNFDGDKAPKRPPCQSFEPMTDVKFWESQLQPGQRSPLWRSHNRILDLYGDANGIYFCYVHVGTEIARVEVPMWVAKDDRELDAVLGMMLAQVQKGFGYPVTLAEAHNQAVVRGGDRARFFALLEQQMIKSGLKNVGTSYKETRKRGSIA